MVGCGVGYGVGLGEVEAVGCEIVGTIWREGECGDGGSWYTHLSFLPILSSDLIKTK